MKRVERAKEIQANGIQKGTIKTPWEYISKEKAKFRFDFLPLNTYARVRIMRGRAREGGGACLRAAAVTIYT